jgi:hypothetical protein
MNDDDEAWARGVDLRHGLAVLPERLGRIDVREGR